MAKLNDIVIKVELRPCYVNGKKAMFHTWFTKYDTIAPGLMIGSHPGGQVSVLFAVVEYEDGTVGLAYPDSVRFIDNSGLFEEIVWE